MDYYHDFRTTLCSLLNNSWANQFGDEHSDLYQIFTQVIQYLFLLVRFISALVQLVRIYILYQLFYRKFDSVHIFCIKITKVYTIIPK